MQIPCVYLPGPAPAVTVANTYVLGRSVLECFVMGHFVGVGLLFWFYLNEILLKPAFGLYYCIERAKLTNSSLVCQKSTNCKCIIEIFH